MNKKQQAVYIYFILLPFIDVITSLIVRFTDLKISLGMVVKGLTLIFTIIYTLFFSKAKFRKKSIKYLLMTFIFFVIYIIAKIQIFSFKFLINELIMFVHYFYFPFMIIGIFNLFNDLKIDNKFMQKILIVNSICYAILLLVPFISGTGFNSYRWNNFFGNNGWFFSANEVGAITVILLSSQLYYLNTDKKYSLVVTFLILLSIALIGTKVSFVGMILMTILIALILIFKKKKTLSLLLIISLMFIGMMSPTINNLNVSHKNVLSDEIDTRDLRRLDEIIENKFLLKTIKLAFNGREDFFVTNYYVYHHSGIVNKFFGIGWTDWDEIDYNYERKLIEIDYLDVFIHYGIIGFLVYFLPVIYIIVNFVKNKTKKGILFWYNIIVFLIGVLISSIAGHVFSAPAVSIYLVLILYFAYNVLKGNDSNEKNSDFYR